MVHVNSAECVFSLLKRGLIGTFHNVDEQHLPLYRAEFDHRRNHRKVSDRERTVAALKKTEGKRLTYKPLTKNSSKPPISPKKSELFEFSGGVS